MRKTKQMEEKYCEINLDLCRFSDKINNLI